MLNSALLKHHYGIEYWNIPDQYLCPPIPGRVDYLHYLADLLAESNQGIIPTGKSVLGLDIGMGANAIYSLLGCRLYQWRFIGSDIDPLSIKSARFIVEANDSLRGAIQCRLQSQPTHLLNGIIKDNERLDFCLCNPPFHSSAEEAASGSDRKRQNLAKTALRKGTSAKMKTSSGLNFGGQSNELWCDGGELAFLTNLVRESQLYMTQCLWFTSLVSKKENIRPLKKQLMKINAVDIREIKMVQGQKITRVLAWSFLSQEEQQTWASEHWQK